MARRGPGPLLGVLLLLVAWATRGVAELVSTPQQLFAALAAAAAPGGPQASLIALQADITLSVELAANYTLPFVVEAGRNVTMSAAGSEMRTLDWGEIPTLLYFKSGSTCVLDNLNISGSADPQLGSWPMGVDSPTVIQSLPFWPTVGADAGFSCKVHACNVTIHPTALCTSATFEAQFDALRQLAVSSGTNLTNLTSSGTTARFEGWAAPIPVLSSATKVAVGTVMCEAWSTELHCTLPEAAAGVDGSLPLPLDTGAAGSDAMDVLISGGGMMSGGSSGSVDGTAAADGSSSAGGAPSGDSGGGGGGPAGWVWAVVGVSIALAAGLAGVALLRWRRRARRLRQQQDARQPLGVKVVGPSRAPSESDLAADKLEGTASVSPPSLASSSSLDPPIGRTIVPEGPWRSRVGFIEGLQLGGLIGRGGYARVYKGRWKGAMVAVKVAETVVGPAQRYDLRDEPLLSLSLSHPNVLQGYKMCAVKILTDTEGDEAVAIVRSSAASTSGELTHSSGSRDMLRSGSSSRVVPHLLDSNCLVQVMPPDAVLEPGMYEMWLVSELADKGTLADAMKAGRFTFKGDPPRLNIQSIMLCLLDVARGLEYLHSCNIVHGDLKPQNVLLKSASTDRRGFVCKLGDFGLSRMLRETETHVQTGSYGTVTHAAPELLKEGRLTKASDVFAFAMVVWELFAGELPYLEMQHMQVIIEVTQHGYRLPIPAACPPPLPRLLERCWAEDPAARPRAAAIVKELMRMMAGFAAAAAKREAATTTVTSGS